MGTVTHIPRRSLADPMDDPLTRADYYIAEARRNALAANLALQEALMVDLSEQDFRAAQVLQAELAALGKAMAEVGRG